MTEYRANIVATFSILLGMIVGFLFGLMIG